MANITRKRSLGMGFTAMALTGALAITGVSTAFAQENADKSIADTIREATEQIQTMSFEDGQYVVQQKLGSVMGTSATSVVFTDKKAPEGTSTVDVSDKRDKSVVSWKDGDICYISTQVEGQKVIAPENCYQMFYNFGSKVQTIDIANLDTSNATNMYSMFYYCRNLQSIDLSHFDTSNVTTMCQMLGNCYSPTSLDPSSFDTSKATDITSLFNGCRNLESIDLSSFDSSNVDATRASFAECSKINELSLGRNWESFTSDYSFEPNVPRGYG